MEYPRKGMLALGFVTNTIQDSATGKRFIVVFIPHTPSPTSGMFEIVRENEVTETGLTVEEGIKMIISGGLITPSNFSLPLERAKPSS